MTPKSKQRQFVHYSLVTCTILIQVVILIFFYNEYFNEKKLNAIEEQLQEARVLKDLMEDSKSELLNAQDNLQKYLLNNERKFLEIYFHSLRELSDNLDSISVYEDINPALKESISSRSDELAQFPNLAMLIDSISRESINMTQEIPEFNIKGFDIKTTPEILDIEIAQVSDSIEKKKFLPRLRDAFKGNVDVVKETTTITISQGNTVDTTDIKAGMDSIITVINRHYLNEIKKYQSHIEASKIINTNLYRIYDNLIVFSNNLMEVYNHAVNEFTNKLEADYSKQNSINNKIRRLSVLGLMILMFFVLIVILHYTRQAFLYEKKLQAANEEIEKNLNFKNRILGMLSHEIRSPLKIINILIDRITKKTKDGSIADYLKSIKFTNSSLLIQANQVLEYTKNQEKQVELNPVEFNLRNEIDTLIQSFKPYIESKNNVFIVENIINPEIITYADNVKIHQIFTNLLGNANKFTDNGTIKLTVTSRNLNKHTLKLSASVSDTGSGMSESDVEMVFEPYFQGKASGEIENLGAGLGLNLCKEIVDLFDGHISLTSVLGEGTTISFELKLNIVQ